MKTKGVVICLGVGAAVVAGALVFALSQDPAPDTEPNPETASQDSYCQQLIDQRAISRQEINDCYQSPDPPEIQAFALLNYCSQATPENILAPAKRCLEWVRPYSGDPAPRVSVDYFCTGYEFRLGDWCGDVAGYERYQQLKRDVGLNPAADPGVLYHPQAVFARHQAAGHYPQSAVWYYFLPAD